MNYFSTTAPKEFNIYHVYTKYDKSNLHLYFIFLFAQLIHDFKINQRSILENYLRENLKYITVMNKMLITDSSIQTINKIAKNTLYYLINEIIYKPENKYDANKFSIDNFMPTPPEIINIDGLEDKLLQYFGELYKDVVVMPYDNVVTDLSIVNIMDQPIKNYYIFNGTIKIYESKFDYLQSSVLIDPVFILEQGTYYSRTEYTKYQQWLDEFNKKSKIINISFKVIFNFNSSAIVLECGEIRHKGLVKLQKEIELKRADYRRLKSHPATSKERLEDALDDIIKLTKTDLSKQQIREFYLFFYDSVVRKLSTRVFKPISEIVKGLSNIDSQVFMDMYRKRIMDTLHLFYIKILLDQETSDFTFMSTDRIAQLESIIIYNITVATYKEKPLLKYPKSTNQFGIINMVLGPRAIII